MLTCSTTPQGIARRCSTLAWHPGCGTNHTSVSMQLPSIFQRHSATDTLNTVFVPHPDTCSCPSCANMASEVRACSCSQLDTFDTVSQSLMTPSGSPASTASGITKSLQNMNTTKTSHPSITHHPCTPSSIGFHCHHPLHFHILSQSDLSLAECNIPFADTASILPPLSVLSITCYLVFPNPLWVEDGCIVEEHNFRQCCGCHIKLALCGKHFRLSSTISESGLRNREHPSSLIDFRLNRMPEQEVKDVSNPPKIPKFLNVAKYNLQ